MTMRPANSSPSQRFFCASLPYSAKTPRTKIAELHHVGSARAYRGDLLDGDHHVHQGAALPAVVLRQRNAHQALLRHQLRNVIGKAWIMGALERTRRKVVLREAAYLLSK